MVELRPHRLLATRLSRCRDSVGCITAMQSRPNNCQLQARLVCRQGWRISTLGSWQFISPTHFQNAQTGRRPGYARPPLPKESASRVENWATFSFDEPQPPQLRQSAIGTLAVQCIFLLTQPLLPQDGPRLVKWRRAQMRPPRFSNNCCTFQWRPAA